MDVSSARMFRQFDHDYNGYFSVSVELTKWIFSDISFEASFCVRLGVNTQFQAEEGIGVSGL